MKGLNSVDTNNKCKEHFITITSVKDFFLITTNLMDIYNKENFTITTVTNTRNISLLTIITNTRNISPLLHLPILVICHYYYKYQYKEYFTTATITNIKNISLLQQLPI